MDDETFETVDRMFATTNEMPSDNVVGSREERNEQYHQERRYWDRPDFPTLGEVVTSDGVGREHDDESIFYYNNSAGLQFTPVANLLYERASEQGLGTVLPLDWFQQDVRN